MSHAELSNQGVDGSHLNPGSSTCISQFCRCNVVFASRLDERQRCKSLNDLCAGPGTGETLKKLLQDQARRDDDVGTQKRLLQMLNLRFRRLNVPAKRQGPNARVDEQSHVRDRSAL